MSTETAQLTGRWEAETFQERNPRPILFWSAVGVVFFCVNAYTLGGWALSGDMRSAGTGPTPVPGFMAAYAWFQQIFYPLLAAVFTYRILIRPWRRQRHLTQDGLFLLAFVLTLPWQDTALNFFTPVYAWSTAYLNLGGWDRWIPGILEPHGNLTVHPVLFDVPFYFWAPIGAMIAGCWFMGWAKARWPRMTRLHLVLLVAAALFVVDIFIELVMWVIPGSYVYGRVVPWLTIFRGRYYQFPMYEPFFIAVWLTPLICLRYFRNDKGQTLVEKGLEQVQVSARTKVWLRWLAMAGVINLVTLVGYNVPMATIGMHGSNWPEDIQNRSYFMNNICGPGTSYGCPGPGLPLPVRDSPHLDPDGNLVVPAKQCRLAPCPGTANK